MISQFYYIDAANQRVGPLAWEILEQLHRSGAVRDETLAAPEGATDWSNYLELRQKRELLDRLPKMPSDPGVVPPAPPPLNQSPPGGQIGNDDVLRFLLPVGRSGLAIAAGYLGLFSFIILPAPIAVIVSILAIQDVRRSRGADQPKHGMGRAVFGLIMGLLGTLALLTFVFLSIFSQ